MAREITCMLRHINAVRPRWRFIGYFNEYDPEGHCEYGRVIGGIDELNAWPTPLDVVIGIGVNLRQRPDDFSPEVARIATSLEAQGYPADRAALETALAEALCQAFGHLHTPAVYAADYRRLCLNLGQTLRIPDTGETVTALDIDRQYGLVVRRRDGTVDTLRCGEVSVRGLYGYV